jgi:hypothetical protein
MSGVFAVKKKLFKQQQVRAGFLHMFGTSGLQTLLLVSVTIVTLAWFSDTLFIFLTGSVKNAPVWSWVLGLCSFPGVIFFWYNLLEKSLNETDRLKIEETTKVPGCKVLIVFLSKIKPVHKLEFQNLLETVAGGGTNQSMLERTTRQTISNGWRMPFEAIAYHLERATLEKVVVIPSKDTYPRNTDNELVIDKGTIHDYPLFKQLVEGTCSRDIKLYNAGEISISSEHGVDFESFESIYKCLGAIFKWLREQGYNTPTEAMIDITSGQKVGSSVASVMSLDLDRKVQYVSTNDYTVRSYNVTYETE